MTDFAASYGASLYSLCKDENITEQVKGDLALVNSLLTEDYLKLLDCPMIDLKKRIALVHEAFSDNVCEYVLNFLKLLTEKKAVYTFYDCAGKFEKLYNKDNNIETAVAVTAVPMSDELLEKLSEKLSALLNKTVIVKNKVDDAMIGGLVVRFADTQIDSSVKTRLDAIRNQISGRMVR